MNDLKAQGIDFAAFFADDSSEAVVIRGGDPYPVGGMRPTEEYAFLRLLRYQFQYMGMPLEGYDLLYIYDLGVPIK